MDKDLKRLLLGWRVLKWFLAIVAAYSSWKATMSAYLLGWSTPDIILAGWWVVGVSAGSLFILFNLGDRTIDWIDRLREGKRVATLLDDSVAVGHNAITVGGLMNVWLENQPENETIRAIKKNTMLRILKGAVRQGLIKVHGEQKEVSIETFCDQKSAATFFRKRLWLDVKDESYE